MRIVQTFWSGGKSLTHDSFGWAHAEYNLMSWALSSYSLIKHYHDVCLYTDSEGKRILIEQLQLPYTEVHVVYDDFPCLPHHWALAKIRTYSLQNEAFLHVDGDVYLPNILRKNILNAPLIAQNREIGTIYYRRMMNRIMSYPSIIIPQNVIKMLTMDSLPSFNMGIFGGNDIDFIHRYCSFAMEFMNKNRMNNKHIAHSTVECNVFFEQILFAVMADEEKRFVASVLDHPVKDEGYTGREFCNFNKYEERPFLHILGGHKRNQYICYMLERTMIRLYPNIYEKILSFFPERHIRFNKNQKEGYAIRLSIERSIAQYEDFLYQKEIQWKEFTIKEMMQLEHMRAKYTTFCNASKDEQRRFILSLTPSIDYYNIPAGWHPGASVLLRKKFGLEPQFPLTRIAVIPALQQCGLREMPIVSLHEMIIEYLKKKKVEFGTLQDELSNRIGFTNQRNNIAARTLIYGMTCSLLHCGVLVASPPSCIH